LVKNETLEQAQAESQYGQVIAVGKAPEQPWNNPKVVRVESTFGQQKGGYAQIVLRLGTLTREWAKTVEDKGGWRYTTYYWKYNFNEEKKVTPKFEGIVDIPEKAPEFVKKMAQKSQEKVSLVTYASDEPTVEITTGRQNFVYPNLWTKKRDYASASGDLLVIGRSDQMDFDTKLPKQVYLLLKYSAEDLSQKHCELLQLEYMKDLAFDKVLADGSMVLVFAPQGGPGIKNKSPNPDKWDYVRVSKDATLIDKISFETIGGPWAISNAILSEDNQVYLYGPASIDKKGKYLKAIVGGLTSFDNIQVMKVGEGTIKYLANVNLKELNSKLVKPSNLKKGDSYSGKDLTFEQNYTLTATGDLLFTAQANDHSALYCFHFGPEGKFKAQYVIASEDQPKEVGIDHAIFENPDQQSVSVFIAELTKVDKNRALKYPRMATINLKDAKISAVQTFGYDKKGEYFLDDIYPYTFIDNGQKIVFFSRDAKDAKLWLGRVKIGI